MNPTPRLATVALLSAALSAGCSNAPGTTDASDAPAPDATTADVAFDSTLDALPDTPLDATLDATVDARPDAAVDARDVLVPPDVSRTQPESELLARRQACAFGSGAWPAETIGTEYPLGADIPINHVLVIMQENRSFDHYLGRLVAQGYYAPGDFSSAPDGGHGSGFDNHQQLDGPPAGWSNPDVDGTIVVPHPDDAYCYGVNHSWEDMHDDYDNGLLDHFVTNNAPNGQKTFYYEDDTVIPFYYALANTFSVGDRYFASVMSSTWPNRYFLMSATSFGLGDNSFDFDDTGATPALHIFSELVAAGHTWRDYTDGPHMESFYSSFGTSYRATRNYRNAKCDLFNDIANSTLPDVSFIMGDEVDETSDEGPSALAEIGGLWVENIVRALMASPSWRDSVVFITYDENGGMADHVPPAPACLPDNLQPHKGDGTPLVGAFDHTGFRVPFIVVSPYARPHYVSHAVYDHTSITRFIEARFGLPAMTARDANATPPMEMFDFQNPPFMTPPNITAHTMPDPAILQRCGQSLAPMGCPDQ